MSVAALEAMQVRRCPEAGDRRLAHRFVRAAAKVAGPAWEMAVRGDLALPEIEGDRPLTLRLTNAYVERLLEVAERDSVVAAAFSEVADLLAPPQNILRPPCCGGCCGAGGSRRVLTRVRAPPRVGWGGCSG
jgi:hypothetical protein